MSKFELVRWQMALLMKVTLGILSCSPDQHEVVGLPPREDVGIRSCTSDKNCEQEEACREGFCRSIWGFYCGGGEEIDIPDVPENLDEDGSPPDPVCSLRLNGRGESEGQNESTDIFSGSVGPGGCFEVGSRTSIDFSCSDMGSPQQASGTGYIGEACIGAREGCEGGLADALRSGTGEVTLTGGSYGVVRMSLTFRYYRPEQ